MSRTARPASTHFAVGIAFHRPVAFWIGTFAISAGACLHLPDYVASAEMGYVMRDMPMSGWMHLGMVLIIGGIMLAWYGLHPRRASVRKARQVEGYSFRAMDDAPLTVAHWGLLFVLGIALVVDVMKPATLGFVAPGMMEEYGISTVRITIFLLSALLGTTIGSLTWGVLADRLGRRAAILLASLMFIGTSICGFMPSFGWNVFMCFVMGLSAGGMLPIVYALMAESVPAKVRGWLVVLHGGMGTVLGYLVASGAATLLEPTYKWRILWFLGLPSGFLMLVLNRWIPESPRFLLSRGLVDEAHAVMERYGVRVQRQPQQDPIGVPAPASSHGLPHLFRYPYVGQTTCVFLYGLSWGLVNWGFILFLPIMLEREGGAIGSPSRLLFASALLAVPGTVLVAWLYGRWSSKKSMVLYALVTTAALWGFASLEMLGTGQERAVLTGLAVLLLTSSGGVISMLSPYTAEVYPTGLRGTGSGLAAGSSKLGGIIGLPLAGIVLSFAPGLGVIAVVMSVPMVLAGLTLAVMGLETRHRALEEIAASPPVVAEP